MPDPIINPTTGAASTYTMSDTSAFVTVFSVALQAGEASQENYTLQYSDTVTGVTSSLTHIDTGSGTRITQLLPDNGTLFVPVANYPDVRGLPGCATATTTCAVGLATNQGLRRQLGGGFDGIKPETGKGWSVGFDFAPPFLPGFVTNVTLFNNDFRGGVTSPNANSIFNSAGLHNRLTLCPSGCTPQQVAAFANTANGVIVSTPTGSTAYTLAANGPILAPDVDALVVTPICPHLLTLRPIVVRGDASLTVRVEGVPTQCLLTVDGQVGFELHVGDEVRCHRSDYTVNLIRLRESGFFDALRSKLSWGER